MQNFVLNVLGTRQGARHTRFIADLQIAAQEAGETLFLGEPATGVGRSELSGSVSNSEWLQNQINATSADFSVETEIEFEAPADTKMPPVGGDTAPENQVPVTSPAVTGPVTTTVTTTVNTDGSVVTTVTTTTGSANQPAIPCGGTAISEQFLQSVATATGYTLDWVKYRRAQWGYSSIEQLACHPCGGTLMLPCPATPAESAMIQRLARQFLGLC